MKILTIICVAHNHVEQTRKFMESLAKWTDPTKYKLIFNDMNSEDETNEYVQWFCRDHGIECKYQFFDENNGRWIEAINRAYPMVETEFSLTVHNDVQFSKQWLEKMMRRFDDPQVAAVGPVITFAMGAQSVNIYQQTFGLDPKYLLGLFFMCRDSVLEEIKYEDGTYLSTAYGYGDKEEFELCHRIREKGYKFKIAYDVLIEHQGEITWVDTLGSKEKFYEYQKKQEKILRRRLGDKIVDDMWEIKIENPIKLMIGIITRTEYIHHRFVISLLKIWGGTAVQKDLYHVARGHVADARNTIIKEFLKTDCTHLLFCDDDMTFEHDALSKLIAHDVGVCSGIAFQRGEPYAPCIFFSNEETKTMHPIECINQGMIKVDAVGGYFILIKREVLENTKRPWFIYGDGRWGHGDPDVGDGKTVGEDVGFSLNCRNSGYDIWIDTDLIIGHIGQEQIIDDKFYLDFKASGKLEEAIKRVNEFRRM